MGRKKIENKLKLKGILFNVIEFNKLNESLKTYNSKHIYVIKSKSELLRKFIKDFNKKYQNE